MMMVASGRTARQAGGLLWFLLVLLLSPIAAASAQERPDASSRWWVAGGALLGASMLLDQQVRGTVPPGGGTHLDPLTDRLNILGNPRYLVPVIAGGFAVGKVVPVPELASSSAHVLGALLVAGVANGSLKSALGRERPVGGDPGSFRPFNLDNRWQSFPSGHATVAFSIATGVAQEADRPWVSVVAYSTAGLVGWSRVYEDKHWASDVVGGALVGIGATRLSLRLLHRHHPHDAGREPATIVIHPAGWLVRIPTP
jgi:membrane-associated phospholipid phosphatase